MWGEWAHAKWARPSAWDHTVDRPMGSVRKVSHRLALRSEREAKNDADRRYLIMQRLFPAESEFCLSSSRAAFCVMLDKNTLTKWLVDEKWQLGVICLPPQIWREQQALHNSLFRRGGWRGSQGRKGWTLSGLCELIHIRLPLCHLFGL